jgi:hypothetical protein
MIDSSQLNPQLPNPEIALQEFLQNLGPTLRQRLTTALGDDSLAERARELRVGLITYFIGLPEDSKGKVAELIAELEREYRAFFASAHSFMNDALARHAAINGPGRRMNIEDIRKELATLLGDTDFAYLVCTLVTTSISEYGDP